MPDPPKGQTDVDVVPSTKTTVERYRLLASIPSFVLNTLGMTCMTFTMGGLAWWMPDYLDSIQKTVVEAAELQQPAPWGDPRLGILGPRTVFGIITALAGLLATISGGFLGDALRDRISGSYFFVSGLGMILGAPFLLLFLITPFPFAWVFGFFAVFGLFLNTGPTNTILANVTHPALRSTGFAFNILIIRLFGDALSPLLLGTIGGLTSMSWAFVLAAGVMAIGGGLWMSGMRFLQKDTALAPSRG